MLFGRQFLSIFTPEADVIDAGMTRLMVMSCSYAFSAFMDATIAAARGLGRSIFPTALVIAGCCVLRIVWVYTVFAWFGTMMSLYLVYIVSWVVTAIAELTYFAVIWRRVSAQLKAA